MHVSYNMHVIDCNMPVTCVTIRIEKRFYFAQFEVSVTPSKLMVNDTSSERELLSRYSDLK